jgi:hypothetical protein
MFSHNEEAFALNPLLQVNVELFLYISNKFSQYIVLVKQESNTLKSDSNYNCQKCVEMKQHGINITYCTFIDDLLLAFQSVRPQG